MASALNRSDSIESAHPSGLGEQGPSRIYQISRPAFHRHYEVKSADDQVLFYGKISTFTHKKPDVTIHAGDSEHTAVMAACKFIKLSGDFKLAIGDPIDENNVVWEDMTKESAIHSKYRFEMTVPNKQQTGNRERRGFLWKRTRHVAVDGESAPILGSRSFKLVDESTGQVLAVFTREISFNKCGKLQIKAEYGEAFEKMVVISLLGLYERARRRNNSAAAGGGGGGG
ncbi:hypothetical protein N7532_010411 [Penicillium argentinense]|uniref:Uncharacterized protein n=1 Tax=Penicillium argentinense TaxID=1131581 RepID=A0A9W9EPR5_9EURO|nr:uncharacterized protein N7532_010411 [Penicillium argentinense]KAJ5085640.1 hypothetical protein N7532_010411 [Penicillium argentinense]